MRIFTGSPYHHVDGGQAFFARDSGLLSRGLQALGVESQAITLGPSEPGDDPAMIRASWEQMEDPEWWKSLNLDGLVFITWGLPLYRRMVEAAVEAGIRVAQMTDAQGAISPLADWKAHLKAEDSHFWYEPKWKRLLRLFCKIPYSGTIRILTRDRNMVRAISSSELFFSASPNSQTRFRNLARRLGDKDAAKRIHFVPLPVNFHFIYQKDIAKQDEVVAVGRWDSSQKRIPLLLETIAKFLDFGRNVRFRIFGTVTEEMRNWHHTLLGNQRELVVLEGMVANAQLAPAFKSAKIMLVSSAYESFHIASAEAICCGTSVVACRSPFLDPIEWQAGKASGRIAPHATATCLAETLRDEFAAWDRGERDPQKISDEWVKVLHPQYVARKVLDHFLAIAPFDETGRSDAS